MYTYMYMCNSVLCQAFTAFISVELISACVSWPIDTPLYSVSIQRTTACPPARPGIRATAGRMTIDLCTIRGHTGTYIRIHEHIDASTDIHEHTEQPHTPEYSTHVISLSFGAFARFDPPGVVAGHKLIYRALYKVEVSMVD